MWFELKGDERLSRCATEGCGGQPTWRLEADGVGSNYCSGCKGKIDGKEPYDPELWRMPDDRIWALKECSTQFGMMPNAMTTKKFLENMALEGLVRQSDLAPIWHLTDKGRAELVRLEEENASDDRIKSSWLAP